MSDDGIWVRNPKCSVLLDMISGGNGIAMAKRTHGVWDHLALLASGGWWADGWRRCDQMIFKQSMPDSDNVRAERREYIRYLNEILADIVQPPDDPRWLQTISLDLDYLTQKLDRPAFRLRPTADPRLQQYWQWRYSYAEVIDRYNLAERSLQFAQILTKGISSLEILEMPEIARSRHVVIVAPEKVRDLPNRWELETSHVTFVPAPTWPDRRPDGSLFTDPVLPALQTYRIRHDLLETLHAVSSERPLLYLFELGTCAQWLIGRLFRRDPTASYVDMGRALELWFPESPWPLKKPVAALYRRAARAYYGQRRYRLLTGAQ